MSPSKGWFKYQNMYHLFQVPFQGVGLNIRIETNDTYSDI